jgi:hypothetical protein
LLVSVHLQFHLMDAALLPFQYFCQSQPSTYKPDRKQLRKKMLFLCFHLIVFHLFA